MPTTPAVTLSIAICTWNRAGSLRILLDDLARIYETSSPAARNMWEVLVVDNGCTDRTAAVLEEFSVSLPLRRVHESRQGLANARNRALAHFSGEAILFLDDDISIDGETLDGYLQAVRELTRYDYFGGPITVDWQGRRPHWLLSDDLVLLNGLFGQYLPATQDLEYSGQVPGPYGANFLLRRRILDLAGGFEPALGVCGGSPGRGEETEYFARARSKGAEGLFLHQAGVRHRFQVERLNIPYLYRYGIAKGQATGTRPAESGLRSAAGFLFRGLWQLARGRRDRFYQCIINLGIIRGQMKRPDIPPAD
jgi:GT2 family glycosyltransferase